MQEAVFLQTSDMKTDILGAATGLGDSAGQHLLREHLVLGDDFSALALPRSHTEVINLCFCHQSAVVKII